MYIFLVVTPTGCHTYVGASFQLALPTTVVHRLDDWSPLMPMGYKYYHDDFLHQNHPQQPKPQQQREKRPEDRSSGGKMNNEHKKTASKAPVPTRPSSIGAASLSAAAESTTAVEMTTSSRYDWKRNERREYPLYAIEYRRIVTKA